MIKSIRLNSQKRIPRANLCLSKLLLLLWQLLLPLLIPLLIPLTLHAEDFQTAFNAGIAAFNSQKWEEAILDFSQAVKFNPNNVAASSNLALSYLKKENYGMAAAYFRKTLELSPGSSEARRGLEAAQAKLENRTIPHEIEWIESLRGPVLLAASPFAFYALFGLSLFATGWIWLSYLGKRRRVKEDTPPPLPVHGILCGILWGVSILLLTVKLWDQENSRGTIIQDQVSVLAAPGENKVELFTLYSGNEVLVRRHQGDWLQIQYPGGPSGWIPKSSILITTPTTISVVKSAAPPKEENL